MREYHGFSCKYVLSYAHPYPCAHQLKQGGNISPFGLDDTPNIYTGITLALIASAAISSIVLRSKKDEDVNPGLLKSFFLFFYSSFLKPHQGDSKGTQQDALESFYSKQAGAYDATRKVLLRGREDMLALVAAQLKAKARLAQNAGRAKKAKRVWVDVRFFTTPSFYTI